MAEVLLSELQGRCLEVYFKWSDVQPLAQSGNFIFTPVKDEFPDINGDGYGDFRFDLTALNVCDPAVDGGADVFYEPNTEGVYGQITVNADGWVSWVWSEPVYYYGFDVGIYPDAISSIYVIEEEAGIAANLNRIIQAKADLKTILELKNIEVGDATIDQYPSFVDQLQGKWVVPEGMKFRGAFTYFDGDGLNISNLTSFNSMFSGCTNMEWCNMSNWDFSNITSTTYMFDDCQSLTSIDLDAKDVSQLSIMQAMFKGCTGMTEVYLAGWNPYNCVNALRMFSGCTSLIYANLSGEWKIYDMDVSNMFDGCDSLETLDLTGWIFANNYSMNSVNLNVCPNLTNLSFGTNLKMTNYNPWYYLTYCSKLTRESVLSIFEGLWDYVSNPTDMTATPTIQFNTALQSVIDDELTAIAVGKGWTIAYGETNN